MKILLIRWVFLVKIALVCYNSAKVHNSSPWLPAGIKHKWQRYLKQMKFPHESLLCMAWKHIYNHSLVHAEDSNGHFWWKFYCIRENWASINWSFANWSILLYKSQVKKHQFWQIFISPLWHRNYFSKNSQKLWIQIAAVCNNHPLEVWSRSIWEQMLQAPSSVPSTSTNQ